MRPSSVRLRQDRARRPLVAWGVLVALLVVLVPAAASAQSGVSGNGRVTTPAGTVEDTLPEDMALVVDTDAGLVVVTGCGHAGIVNILDYARTVVRPAKVHAVIGGLHLFNASEQTLAWTAGQLKAAGVENLIGAHCTGVETVYRFRTDLGLDRPHAVVGAVGATFELAP